MKIPFSPPDISEREIESVVETLRSGWITTGPKTKEFEKQIAEYVGTEKAVCLNSSTAAMEMTLRLLGVYSQLQCYLSCGGNSCHGRYSARSSGTGL